MMITITEHVLVGEIECVVISQFDTFEEYMQYIEYHKNSV